MDVRLLGNNQAHSLELKAKACENDRASGKTWVNFDLAQMGLACVNSWGAWPRWEYQMPYGDYEYTFVIRSVK